MSDDLSPRKLRPQPPVDYTEQSESDDDNSFHSDSLDVEPVAHSSAYALSDTSLVITTDSMMAEGTAEGTAATRDLLTEGKEAGLSGRDLLDYVRQEREAEERMRVAEERRRRFDLEALEAQEKREAEAEAAKLKAEEEKRRFELEARRVAMEEASLEYALANPEEAHSHQLALAAASAAPKKAEVGIIADKIRLPYLDDKDDVDTYLTKFERIAAQLKWDVTTWALRLSGHLKGKAAEVYTKLPMEVSNDYEALKNALLKAFHCTAKTYREKFRAAKRVGSETYEQLLDRSKLYLDRWLQLAKGARDFDSLYDLIRLEQFIDCLPAEVKAFVKERLPTSADAAAEAAQAFLEAHEPDCRNPFSRRPAESVNTVHPPGSKKRGKSRRTGDKSMGKVKGDKSTGKVSGDSASAQDKTEQVSHTNAPQVTKKKRHCTYCNRDGHDSDYCRIRAHDIVSRQNQSGSVSRTGDAPASPAAPTPEGSQSARAVFGCVHVVSRDGSVPKLRSRLCPDCQAATAGDNYIVKVKVCGTETEALRDTGSNISLARRAIVPESCFTGKTRDLTGAFGPDSRAAQIAHVFVETPYYTGTIEINVVEDLNTSVLIGNFFTLPSGVTVEVPTYGPRDSCAVVTRAQAKKDARGDLPLNPQGRGLQKTRQELIDAQESDPSLKRMRDLARDQRPWSAQGQGRVRFLYRANVLYREYCGSDQVFHRQVCVPQSFRAEVLTLGHASPMAGHLAARRTLCRIWSDFYWPGMSPDTRRFVASCDACQRTVPRGSIRKVALEKMPRVDVPFERVAIDLIGPIHPPSDRGHRFVLVAVDYATRYPEAIPLKKIDAVTVAEALWQMWTRVGIPKEVLSDNGSQFRSEVMSELYKLMQVNGLYTTPYHAQGNGLVERFNGTLKSMLKRLCSEQPGEWDRFIPAALFAYREAPQESLGFSPFEMLYGRAVRGPMQILRQLWTQDEVDPEVRTTGEYIVDLRNRLEATCELAREALKKASDRHAAHFDRKTVPRSFQVGDQVLLLLPLKKNKLEIAWQGPYEVVERCGPCDYRILVGTKRKIFHANLLKAYIARADPVAQVNVVIQAEDASEVEYFQEGTGAPCPFPLMPLVQEEFPSDVQVDKNLPKDKQTALRAICSSHAPQLTDLPCVTSLEECEVILLDDMPVRVRQYPLPHATLDTVKKEVESMLRLGVIEQCISPYSAPMVLVRKKNGQIRFCLDYRALNRVVRFDAEPMPDVDQLFSKLSRAQYFSKIDMTKGYWQIPVRKSDRDKLAFSTPLGQFRWITMPFGLKTAGAVFSRMMRRFLVPLHRDDVVNFIDDVLIANEEWDTHLAAVGAVFDRMAEVNLAARPKKCFLGFQEVGFLGYRVGFGCLRPELEKTEQFCELSRPTTKTEVRRFLGMVGFYRRFVPHFAEIALPLTDLTKGKRTGPVTWSPQCESSFVTLRDALTTRPVLKLPDVSLPFRLRTDASDRGLGAVLLQDGVDGEQPVSFASKKLTPAELNYATIEKECLAIVWGIRRFEPYLFGHHFVVQTDHQPLQYLQQARPLSGRLARWALQLQQYSFRVESIPGSQNIDADFLSREACGYFSVG